MNNRVLITGGAGFIGSNLANKLIEKGYIVTVLDNLSKQIHGENHEDSPLYKNIKHKVSFIYGDVRNKADWEIALKNQDSIIHLAAETGTGQSMYEVEKYSDVNVSGTAIMLDLIQNKKCEIKKIVVASSRAIYGEGKYHCAEHGEIYPLQRTQQCMLKGDFQIKCPCCNKDAREIPTSEDSLTNCLSIYALTKYMQENMCMMIGKAMDIPVVSLRYQNVYGPGQSLANPYTGILSIFSTRIKNGNDINIFEDGKESRDFVYIDDVVDATILALEKEEANYECFNVGSGRPVNVLEVAELLKKKFNSDIHIHISGNYRIGDIRHNYADLLKIKKMLGFAPKYEFEYGISRFVDWVNKQAINDDNYDRSIEELKVKGLYK
ncbi:NAD-dependent epimerase/dehydratase family protein [Dendrosporobacter sp. 1207_IL3150]|uniref:NAD-dependent epimerase/dehydratase family protein n=1 Tax=Dendrosporobacter sp. 1207_IL3150 TaxID=3084054 RepID=UPI002FDA3C55